MPYRDGDKWRGQVRRLGKRYTRQFDTKKAAGDWERDKWKELGRCAIPTVYLSEAATEYLAYCEASFHPITFKNKRTALKELARTIGNRPIEDIDPSAILHEIILKQATPALANERRKHLSAFFAYCRDFHGLAVNPVARIHKLPVDREPCPVPTEAEFLKLLLVADRHDRNLLVACAATGGRRSEILRWTWTDDINFRDGSVCLCNRKNPKRELRCRTVAMNAELRAALDDQWKTRLPDSDHVFQNRALWKRRDGTVRKHPGYGQRFTARRRFMAGLCKKAKIEKRIGFHALRRFFASMLADNRESLPTIQKLLGHAAVSTTDRYVHRLRDDTRTAVNKLSWRQK